MCDVIIGLFSGSCPLLDASDTGQVARFTGQLLKINNIHELHKIDVAMFGE